MSVTVTPPLAKPANLVATLQTGGTLLPETTYYVRITVKSNGYYRWSTYISSPVSDEISFTTTITELSATISWDVITGANSTNVYLSTVSNVYLNKRIAIRNNVPTQRTSGTSYLIDSPDVRAGQDTFSVFEGKDLPGKIDKELGNLQVSFNGTTTLQDIHDAIGTAGYSTYVTYDGINFALKGGFYCTGTTAGTLTEYDKSIICFQGGMRNDNPNLVIQFGYTDATGRLSGGCRIYASWESLMYSENITLYSCYVSPSLCPAAQYNQTGWSGPMTYAGLVTPSATPSLSKGTMFDGCGIKSGTLPPMGLTINMWGYAHWTGVSEDMVVSYANGSLGQILDGYKPGFRNWDYNNNLTHFYSRRNGALEAYEDIKVYDCVFKVNNVVTADNLPVMDYATYDRLIEIYASITLKVLDADGVAVDGATVILTNKDRDEVINTTTDVDGLLAKTDVLRANVNWSGSTGRTQINTLLSPFILTVTKSGYVTYKIEFNLEEQINWTISLKKIYIKDFNIIRD